PLLPSGVRRQVVSSCACIKAYAASIKMSAFVAPYRQPLIWIGNMLPNRYSYSMRAASTTPLNARIAALIGIASLAAIALSACNSNPQLTPATASQRRPTATLSPTPQPRPSGPVAFKDCGTTANWTKPTLAEMQADVFKSARFGDGLRPA